MQNFFVMSGSSSLFDFFFASLSGKATFEIRFCFVLFLEKAKSTMSGKPTVIHWFRKGLRVHDNPALVRAIEEAVQRKAAIRPMFMLDPGIIKWYLYRYLFIHLTTCCHHKIIF